jgi:hypothetical protein
VVEMDCSSRKKEVKLTEEGKGIGKTRMCGIKASSFGGGEDCSKGVEENASWGPGIGE